MTPPGPAQTKALDDLSLYPSTDPTGLRHRLRTFHLQCLEAWTEANAFELPCRGAGIKRVVVAGMGGSAIGGDLLVDLASLEDSPPITVSRDYQIPHYVDNDTLVLVCSYSGDTEESLSSLRQAVSRGAMVICVTRGGALGSEARRQNVPLFTVGYEGEPRSALGYSFIVPMVLLVKLGLISNKTRDFEETVGVLEGLAGELAEETPLAENPAKELAGALLNRLVVVYGAGIFCGAARRWKTQFNENSKVWAFFELLPEAHHNSVIGYGLPSQVKRQAFGILLRPGFLHPRTCLRYQVSRELLEKESIPQRTVEGRGESALSQMLSVTILGDYTSYYLALLQGVDPSPVPAIDFIKERLASLT